MPQSLHKVDVTWQTSERRKMVFMKVVDDKQTRNDEAPGCITSHVLFLQVLY